MSETSENMAYPDLLTMLATITDSADERRKIMKTIDAAIEQAVQVETDALRGLEVELTAEIFQLRAVLEQIQLFKLQAPDRFSERLQFTESLNTLQGWAKDAISKPSPVGFGDTALALLAASLRVDAIEQQWAFGKTWVTEQAEESKAALQELHEKIETLTPEQRALVAAFGKETAS